MAWEMEKTSCGANVKVLNLFNLPEENLISFLLLNEQQKA